MPYDLDEISDTGYSSELHPVTTPGVPMECHLGHTKHLSHTNLHSHAKCVPLYITYERESERECVYECMRE